VKLGIVGSGIVGLWMAHGLRQRGHEVTLYSARTGEQWLHDSAPTGGAGRFRDAIALERSIGLGQWEHAAPWAEGVHLTLSTSAKNRILTLVGKVNGPAMAVDMRLQIHRWMEQLVELGGQVVVEAVDVARLDAISREHDLTFVAVGRGPLCDVFPRDAVRSLRSSAPRQLAMVIVDGGALTFPGVPFRPVRFHVTPDDGETFWTPYLHKSGKPMWSLLVEAKAGGAFDRFAGATDGHEVLARMKTLIAERLPWDAEWVKDMVLADEHGWLVGEIVPSIRGPAASLPSGRAVMALGDTAMSMDPCAGQGANNGARMVRSYLAAIDAAVAEGRALDAAFMSAAFEAFYADSGERTFVFSDLLTQPMAKGGQALLLAQYGSTGSGTSAEQRIADAIGENFVVPGALNDCFVDEKAAHAFIAKMVGGSARWHLFKKTLAVGLQQLRQAVGLQARHP